MADETPETTHFGFTRISNNEPFSKNGWAFTDLDRTKLDQLLYAALTHTHDGIPALGDPTDPPTLTANPTGGTLSAATEYFYRCSFVDENGLETAASTEASIITPDPMAPPTPPSTSVDNTNGSLPPGTYAYLITFVDIYGGETTPSALASAQVVGAPNVDGGGTNRIRLDMPTFPSGAIAIKLYRSRPGQSSFYYLDQTTSASFYDDGLIEDQTITAPSLNTTSASNSISITIPGDFIPESCGSWRIYRATSSGGYDGYSLVHEVTEGETDTSTTPVITWVDDGDALQAGFPQNTSSTVPHGSLLTLNELEGKLGLSTTARGAQVITAFTPTTGDGVFFETDAPGPIAPVRLTISYGMPQTNGATKLYVTDHEGTQITVQFDGSGSYAETTWPLVASLQVEAESGVMGDNAVVENDDAALNGSSVSLTSSNDTVTCDMGVLDKGYYNFFANIRVDSFASTENIQDLYIEVVNANTASVLASTDISPQYTGQNSDGFYYDRQGPGVQLLQPTHINVRVAKNSNANATRYNVDTVRFAADAPVLAAGHLQFEFLSNTTDGANANVALWF